MEIQNNFKIKIKPYEWLYVMTSIIIIILVIRGDMQTAIELLKNLVPKPK